MDESTRRQRLREHDEQLAAAVVRSLSGMSDLTLRGHELHHGATVLPVRAPHLFPEADEDLHAHRGAADGMGLRMRYSDPSLHRALTPDGPVQRLLFEILEQLRVEALAPSHLAGVRENLRVRHAQWSRRSHHDGLTETARGLLVYALVQVCRSRLSGEPVLEDTQELIEQPRAMLTSRLGRALTGLRHERHDQQAYGEHARRIAETVAGLLGDTDAAEADDLRGHRARLPLPLITDDTGEDIAASEREDRQHEPETANVGYRVFTNTHDRQEYAATLVRPELLRNFREHLDARIAAQHANIPGFASAFRRLLGEPITSGRIGGQEEGLIDGRQLTRLITSPTERRVFEAEPTELLPSTLVTILIDCSGSMKEHAESIAMLADVLARTLDLAGIASELLGFTTTAWNGGKALRDWRRAGRPRAPGRLNERRHLVFKDARTPWRRARSGIAALLKTDLYREGIDGEAVLWALERAQDRDERHHILLVLSDGGPHDTATALVNDDGYLDDHLEGVVRRTERYDDVHVHGLGVGLDLSRYYTRSHTLELSDGIGNRVLREILGVFAQAR